MKLKTYSTTYAWLIFLLIALVIITVVGWVNMQFVGELPEESTFQINWEISRGLIFRGENPYNNPNGIPFTSPLPAIIFYSPFALIENYDRQSCLDHC